MKKFTALFICLLMVITCGLAGCAGFSINKVKYYNEVLAEVGDTHITRYELLSAYNSYGSNYYVSQQGESEEEALSSTLDLLIDREALYQHASNTENNAKYKPTAYQVNSVVEEMYKSLDSQMESYETKAKTILNIESEEAETEANNDGEKYLYSDYVVTNEERRAEVKDTITYYTDASKTTVSATETEFYTITSKIVYNKDLLKEPTDYEKLLEDKYLNNHKADGIITAIQTKYLETYKTKLQEKDSANADKIYNKAVELLVADLMEYERYLRDENGKAYSKNTNDLLYRYFERNFDSQIKSQYLENVRVEYLKDDETSLSIDLLLDKFNEMYTISYNTYNNRESVYKDKMKNIGTDADSILYHPSIEEDDTEFGYFVHTLISFNDNQKSLYEVMEKLATQDKKDEALTEIINKFSTDENAKIHPRNSETGLVDESVSYTLSQVIEEYNNVKAIANYEERLSAFVEFMFKYTGDTATLKAGMPYVVGTNGYSAMMQQFTDECIELMQTSTVGAMSNADVTDLDSICITSYGIHLVMYVGKVDAYDFPTTDTDTAYIRFTNDKDDANGIYNLYHKLLNPLTKETYFDMLFNTVYPQSGEAEVFTSKNGYSDYEEGLIETAKQVCGVKKYVTKIENTKTSF